MNIEDSYSGHDMSDREYWERVRRERARDQYYENARRNQQTHRSSDSSAYRFSSDDDDMSSLY